MTPNALEHTPRTDALERDLRPFRERPGSKIKKILALARELEKELVKAKSAQRDYVTDP